MKKGYRLNSLSSFNRVVKQATFAFRRELLNRAGNLSVGTALSGLGGGISGGAVGYNTGDDTGEEGPSKLLRRSARTLGGVVIGAGVGGGVGNLVMNRVRKGTPSFIRGIPDEIDPWTGKPSGPRRPPRGDGPAPWDGSGNPWDD